MILPKFSFADAERFREEHKSGISVGELARRNGCNYNSMRDIIDGKSYPRSRPEWVRDQTVRIAEQFGQCETCRRPIRPRDEWVPGVLGAANSQRHLLCAGIIVPSIRMVDHKTPASLEDRKFYDELEEEEPLEEFQDVALFDPCPDTAEAYASRLAQYKRPQDEVVMIYDEDEELDQFFCDDSEDQ